MSAEAIIEMKAGRHKKNPLEKKCEKIISKERVKLFICDTATHIIYT
jgi:hypothetical protein